MAPTRDIAVVHLVWEPLGLDPFERYVASYRRNEAGANHDFVLLFNGFGRSGDVDRYLAMCRNLNPTVLTVETRMWDIPAYVFAANKLEAKHVCYLNSYSEILAPDWLAKMYAPLQQRPRISLVGATGSYESHYSSQLAQFRFSGQRLLPRRAYQNLRTFAALERSRSQFPPFPAPHVRTNAFLLPREKMLRLRVPRLKSKLDCYRFESGKDSMTNQLKRDGHECVVVGRDGKAYAEHEWSRSATFRSGEQRNLLVADNQTRTYASADAVTQAMVRQLTWGEGSEEREKTSHLAPNEAHLS